MPNVASLLKDEITRVSRKEVRRETLATKKATAQHRHLISALNKKVVALERQVAFLSRKVLAATPTPAEASPKKFRFSPKALLTQRNRLGLSAAQFGSLVGVSAQSIYNWERGKATPRAEQLAKVAALRGLGKREAAKRLERLQSK